MCSCRRPGSLTRCAPRTGRGRRSAPSLPKKVSDAAATNRKCRQQIHRRTTRNRWPNPLVPPHSLHRLVRPNPANDAHILDRHQEAPSAAPEGQGESSPGQRSAATAALGKRPPPTSLPLSTVRRARLQAGAADRGKREILFTSLPRTALRLSGATLMSSLRDFSLSYCARKSPNDAGQALRARGIRLAMRVQPRSCLHQLG